MRINLPILKQPTNKSCGTTCLRIVLAYHGIEISEKTISKNLIKDQEGGTFITELARFAKTLNLKATCFAYNLYLTDPSTDKNIDSQTLINKLEKLKNGLKDNWFLEMTESIINTISSGISYIIKKPNIYLFKSYLRQAIPIIISVNYTSLYNKQGNPFEGHNIILNGFKEDYFWFIDPEHGIQDKIHSKQLMFSLHSAKIIARSAYMLIIEKSL